MTGDEGDERGSQPSWWTRISVSLEGWVGLAALTGTSIAAGVAAVLHETYLSPSLLWAHHLASLLPSRPLDVVFLAGASPVSAVAFAPFAALGLEGFACAHVVVVSMTVPLVAMVARARGASSPNLAAFFVALSPTFLAAGPSGVAGADGALLVALALYAFDVRRSPLAAGVVLGLLPLVRPELVVVAIGVAITRHDMRTTALAVALPIVFWLTGAVVAGDVRWIVDALLSPSLTGPPAMPDAGHALEEATNALGGLSPALGLLPFLPLGISTSRDSSDLVVAVAHVTVVLSLGFADVGAVGLGPERLLPALSLLGPLLARAVPGLARRDGGERGVLFLLVTALLFIVSDWPLWIGVAGAWAALTAIARLAPSVTTPLVIVATAAAGFALTPWSLLRSDQHANGLMEPVILTPELPTRVRRVEVDDADHPQELSDPVVEGELGPEP